MISVDARGSLFAGSYFRSAHLGGVFTNVNFKKTTFRNVFFVFADLRNTDFTDVNPSELYVQYSRTAGSTLLRDRPDGAIISENG